MKHLLFLFPHFNISVLQILFQIHLMTFIVAVLQRSLSISYNNTMLRLKHENILNISLLLIF